MPDQTYDCEALLEQFQRLEGLDLIPRTGYLQRGIRDPESVAEHSWHVATIAWSLLPYVQPLNDVRALELGLLHDVGERLIGDLPRPARRLFPEGAKEEAEEIAMGEVLAASGERGKALAAELRTGTSLEARFIHHCDHFQLLLKTATYADWQRGSSSQFFDDLMAKSTIQAARNDNAQFAIFDELREALGRLRSR